MSAMPWTAEPVTADTRHPSADTSRSQARRITAAPSVRAVPGDTTPPRPVCDLVAVEPRRRHGVQQWIDRYVRTVLEIVAGERPAAQVARWTALDVHHDLCRRAHLVARATRHAPPRAVTGSPAATGAGRQARTDPRTHPYVARAAVRSVHVSFIDDDLVEASVHVRQGERSRAFAARFEWRRDRWVCTALDFC